MEPNQERSLILRSSQELMTPLTAGSRILSEIVESSLALVREIAPAIVDLDSLVREGKRIQRKEGMTAEDVEAFELFYRAAMAGHAEAQCNLSQCYALGNGIQKDTQAALMWLQKSADQSYPPSLFSLGVCYEAGILGLPHDFDESVKWYRKAAEQGNADAQCKMGESCSEGFAVPRDYVRATEWYLMAAKQGNADAQYKLGLYFSGGDKEHSPVSGSRDTRFLRELFDERLMHALANLFLGEQFHFDVLNARTGDTIIPANCKITRPLLRKLVNDHAPADIHPPMLAGNIQKIIAVFKREAAKWFRDAAENGHADAQMSLAICYQFGDGVEVDPLQAYAWFQLAADGKADLAKWSRASLGFVLTADDESTEAKKAAAIVAAALSQPELETAQRLCREFKRMYSAKQ